jgi:hypothetical protein
MAGGRRGRQRRIATPDELDEAALHEAALEQDVAAAGRAAEADVGAEPVHEPCVPTARMGPRQPDDVAEEQLEHWSGGHDAPERIRGAACRSSG